MAIEPLDHLPEHAIDHAALNVRSKSYNDDRYVLESGDTMTGDLVFPATGYIATDANGVQWRITVGTNGARETTKVETTPIGSPWLFLFTVIQ